MINDSSPGTQTDVSFTTDVNDAVIYEALRQEKNIINRKTKLSVNSISVVRGEIDVYLERKIGSSMGNTLA